MSNPKPNIRPKEFLGYIFGLRSQIGSAVEEVVDEAPKKIPMDEDGNGIPDWLEEPDTSIGSSDDTVSSSSFDDSEEDFLISETDKKREVIDYPSWLTEEIGFMSDAGEQDLYHDEIATASEDILLPPTSPHVESFQEPETFEEPIVTTLKQALTKEKEPEVLKQEMHEDRPESVPESDHVIRASNDQGGVTLGVDIGGEDITIGEDARKRHTYIIGKTGMGKTSMLENIIMQDIKAGRGVGLIDPHGDLYQRILEQIPKSRTNDIVLFDASDIQYPVGFNILENNQQQLPSLIASSLIGVFKKIFGYSWGPRMEYILRNATLTLLEVPDSTLLTLALLLTDADYRRRIVSRLDNEFLKRFWEEEFFAMAPTKQSEVVSPILNKIGQFLSVPLIRNIVAQPKSSFSLRWVMDKQKIFLANLSKGKIGEDVSEMIGSMLVTKFQLDAMSRADIPESERSPFYMYVDEFQNFATESFANILSESRKYGLALTLAHQYIGQIDTAVQQAVLGNVSTAVCFQVGYNDAKILAPLCGKDVTTEMLTDVAKYQFFTRTRTDAGKELFTGSIYPPKSLTHIPNKEGVEKILRVTREKFASNREFVEEKIIEKVTS